MATITFKAKAVKFENIDGSDPHLRIQVPTLTRRHCDMDAFRRHPKFGSYANSDFFPGMLGRIRTDLIRGTGPWLRLDDLPANVHADTGGFLATITIEV